MPYVFPQPIDLGEVIPPVQPSSKGGAKAPPPVTQPTQPRIVQSYILRTSKKQWTESEGVNELKKLIIASSNPADIPDGWVCNSIADAVFNDNQGGSFYTLLTKGIPVYRPSIDAVIKTIMEKANAYGQNFPMYVSFDQHFDEEFAVNGR